MRLLPVNVDDDGVDRKGRWVNVVQIPNTSRSMVVVTHAGIMGRVVYRGNNGKKPGKDGQDLVGGDGTTTVGFPLAEGVDWRRGC